MSEPALKLFQKWSVIICCHDRCGISFAVMENQKDFWRNKKTTFYCPYGHPQGFYGDNEADKLRKQLEQKQKWLDQANAAASRERDARIAAETKERAHRGAKTRLKNRIANGVCPCCNRTFKNLSQHMQGEHPDFGKHENLKAIRMARNITQSALAKEIGISAPYISLSERGKRLPVAAQKKITAWLEKENAE
jgi:DNA-binding XRE family transcriptional regulator